MQISADGLALIRDFEGLRLTVYLDMAGRPTIGVGHLLKPGESYPQGISEAQAMALLRQDVTTAVEAVNRLVKVMLNQNQFDALVDFTYNLGEGNLAGSTLLRLLNTGEYEQAAAQFVLWDHAGGVVSDGLLRRREAERQMFVGP